FFPRQAAGEEERGPRNQQRRYQPPNLLRPWRRDIAVSPEIKALEGGEGHGAGYGGGEDPAHELSLRTVYLAHAGQASHKAIHGEGHEPCGGDEQPREHYRRL